MCLGRSKSGFKDRSFWVFSQNGALLEQADRNGNGLRITRGTVGVVRLQQLPGGREVHLGEATWESASAKGSDRVLEIKAETVFGRLEVIAR